MRNIVFSVAWAVVAFCVFSAFCANAQQSNPETLVKCNFRPLDKGCETLWKAGDNSNPAVESVKAAYESYGRYLGAPTASLTDEDRRYLANNAIRLPEDLTSADLSGLHHVINDPALTGNENARRIAVNGFITRAVEAELYCGFNACGA